jgi:hypothetical protein
MRRLALLSALLAILALASLPLWGQVQYVPPSTGGDVTIGTPGGAAGLDENGELLNPEVVTGSFLLNGAGAPSSGSCPHEKAIYRDTTTLGDTYICYGVGQNWHLIGENDDAIMQIDGNTGSVVASGPTNISVIGAKGLSTAASGSTITVSPALKERYITIIDVAATHDNTPFGHFRHASTVTAIWCRCSDVTGTLPTFTLKDGAGNALTITDTNPTCTSESATYAPKAITAANVFVAGESLLLDTTNTPTAGKTCTIGIDYEIN